MPITDNFRHRIHATQELLASEGRASGTPQIVAYLRTERPIELSPQDEDAIWDGGWSNVVGAAVRSIKTSGGERTVFSIRDDEGRSYRQLQLFTLTDVLDLLKEAQGMEHSYAAKARGWWDIAMRMRVMPEGAILGDLFPTTERWDTFWEAIRASDLWAEAA